MLVLGAEPERNMPVSSLGVEVAHAAACPNSTILVQAIANMHYTGAALVAAPFILLIKSTGCGAHYFGTLNAVVFVTRPGQTGCF